VSRLFITERELNLISDITKEVVKDVVGQKIFLFPISELKTQSHEVYNEAIKKVYENPIEVDALVGQPEATVKVNNFGVDRTFKVEVYLQWRDVVDKGISVNVGDYFSYGDNFYEIAEYVYTRNIYGQVDHKDGMKITGTKVREGQFRAKMFGPTDISNSEDDAVQKTFEQQRGAAENSQGPTNDRRELIERGVLDRPLTGPKSVNDKSGSPSGNAFYGEDS